MEPTVGLKVARSKIAPPSTVNAVDVGNALLAPNCKVPPLIVVLPTYVFILLRINVPEPLLVKLPPVITPDTCPSFTPAVVAVLVVLIAILPVVVLVLENTPPLLMDPPSDTLAPLIETSPPLPSPLQEEYPPIAFSVPTLEV